MQTYEYAVKKIACLTRPDHNFVINDTMDSYMQDYGMAVELKVFDTLGLISSRT